MGYVELPDVTGYLNQLRDLDPDDLDLQVVGDCLTRAHGFVNTYLGTTSNLTASDEDTRTLYGDGTVFLSSDVPMSAVTLVEAPSGYSVPDYVLIDGVLRITDSSGVLLRPAYPSLGGSPWPYGGGWGRDVPYSVTATFGYSAADLGVLAEATLQTTVQLWRYRDSGGSETIGAEGGVTTVRAGWTPLVKEGLDAIKRRMRGNSVGVW